MVVVAENLKRVEMKNSDAVKLWSTVCRVATHEFQEERHQLKRSDNEVIDQ